MTSIGGVRSFATIRMGPGLGRAYFGIQAAAGAVWWLTVALSDFVRHHTLGDLDPVIMAILDIPLFVLASAVAAFGVRVAVWTATLWTTMVAGGMAVYATVTTEAGWGALIMVAAAGGSVVACTLVIAGSIPSALIITGPFAFRTARAEGRGTLLLQTISQTLVFWLLFLVIFPVAIAFIEMRWGLTFSVPIAVRIGGVIVLLVATGLAVWSAMAMTLRGRGTPLPSAMPKALVIAGPYRLVRNPMAVAGIAQGMAIGLILGSWLVVLYALSGSLIWNWMVRPHEEADLAERFGDDFDSYRARVSCWIPRRPRVRTD